MPRPPVLSSATAPWHGFRLEHFKGGPVEVTEEAPVWHHVLVQLDQPSSYEWRDGERSGRVFVPAWNVAVFPALKPVTLRNSNTNDFLCLAIEPEFLHFAAHEIAQPGRFELASSPVNEDPLVRGLALALQAELRCGCPGGRWYGESLARALAVHLVRRYPESAMPARENEGTLGRNRLRKAMEFIHLNLASEIRLDQLARTTGLSPYHFARLFKRSTGLAPHQYVIRRRVERARELLVTTSGGVSEIAVQSGFCDQSHLTTHFKRVYGVTPRVFVQEFAPRRNGN